MATNVLYPLGVSTKHCREANIKGARMRFRGISAVALVAALMLALVLPVGAGATESCSSPPNPVNVFTDVANDSSFCVEISWLSSEGITTGREDGTFGPSDNLTRGQMAAFLYRAEGEPEVAADAPTFPDVSAGSSFADAISWLASEGITTGRADGTFGPSDNLTRGQMAAFLYRYAGEPLDTGPDDVVTVTGFVGSDLQRDVAAGTFSFSLVEDATEDDNVQAGNVIAAVSHTSATLFLAGQPASDKVFAAAVTDADVIEYRAADGVEPASVDLVDERVRPMMFKIQRFNDGHVYGDGGAAPGSTFTLTISDDDPATEDIEVDVTAGGDGAPSRFGTIALWELGNPQSLTGGVDVSGLSDPLTMTTEFVDDYGPLRNRVQSS